MARRTAIGFGTSNRRGYNRPGTFALRIGSQLAGISISISNRGGGIEGKIFSGVGRSVLKSLEFSFDEKGCAGFVMELNALPSFSINPMSFITVNIFNTSFSWYSGLILDVPDFGVKRKGGFRYSGQGLTYYLTGSRGLKANTSYAALLDVGEVVADIAQNFITPFSSINYDSSKIVRDTGVVLASTIEISKAPIADVLDALAEMAGCRWGVDGDQDLYFELKVEAPEKTRFAGHQVYKFEPNENHREIKNTILVTKQAGTGSNESGWAIAGNYSDATSISKYGKRELIYQIPAFFDAVDADIIGNALLAKYKDPQTVAKFTARLKGSEDYYETGKKYRTITPHAEYNRVWLPLDDKNLFTKFGSGDSAIFDDPDVFLYGSGGIRIEAETAQGDAWVVSVPFTTGVIEYVRFWIRATVLGNFLTIFVGPSYTLFQTTVPVPVTNKFFPIEIRLDGLGVSSLIDFIIKLDSNFTQPEKIWIDKVEVISKESKAHTLELKRISYNFKPGSGTSVTGEMGQVLPEMGDYVESLIKQASEFQYVLEQR